MSSVYYKAHAVVNPQLNTFSMKEYELFVPANRECCLFVIQIGDEETASDVGHFFVSLFLRTHAW